MHATSIDGAAMRFSGGGGDCVVILLNDPDPLDTFALHVAAALGARGDCGVLRIPAELALLDPAALRGLLAERGVSGCRLVCAGYGSSANAAIAVASRLDGDGVLAIAPEPLDADGRSLADRLADARCPALLVTGADCTAASLAHLANAGEDRIRVDPTDLAAVAVPVALQQSGRLEAMMDWLVAKGAPPALGGLRAAWRAAMAHRFEIDTARARFDTQGGLHLSGRLSNLGTRTLPIGRDTPDRLLVGARLIAGDDSPIVAAEARSALAGVGIVPGESAPFQLRLADVADRLDNARVEVSLICEGRFWYGTLGFGMPKESMMAQPTTLEDYKRIRSGTGKAATLDDLWYCYRLLLDREPDPAGFEAHAAVIGQGMTVDQLMRMFVSSPEYGLRLQASADASVDAESPEPQAF